MNYGVDPGKQGTTRKTILQNLKLENKYLQMWNMMFVVCCTIGVSVDPLFFYLPVINEENKCLALDNKLKIAAICLRSVTDMVYVMNIILQFLCPYIDEAPLKLGRTVIVTDAWRIAEVLVVLLPNRHSCYSSHPTGKGDFIASKMCVFFFQAQLQEGLNLYFMQASLFQNF